MPQKIEGKEYTYAATNIAYKNSRSCYLLLFGHHDEKGHRNAFYCTHG